MTKAKGNMYEFITHTWNPIKGRCYHDCSYCYMEAIRNRFNQPEKEPYLDEKELKANLGEGNSIFVGSSCDMWAENIPDIWIYRALEHCRKYPDNEYLFQSKNPDRFFEFYTEIPADYIIGATIETNRVYPCMGKTPPPDDRSIAIDRFCNTFITIEPILDFDLDPFGALIKNANPYYVNIGADSGNNHLPEPEPDKIRELIKELEKFTKVNLKKNLKRLLPEVGA